MGIGPLSFAKVQGQEQAKGLWRRVFASGRLAHAYVFRGPDGVGKRLFAGLAAAQINCLEPTEEGACGRCPSCRKYQSGNHPDLTVVSPDGATIKIDRIREVCRSLSFPPYESAVRVVVIEDVHTLRSEAANSLLKTLEEPPEHNVLILTAESSRVVLPTILSRCQIIPFYPLNDEQMVSVLQQQLEGLADRDARILATTAAGSPGRALLLHREHVVDAWQNVLESLAAAEKHEDQAVSLLLHAAERAAALKQYLPLLFDLLRLWVRKEMESRPPADHGGRNGPLVSKLAAIERAERRLARNCNRSLVCEVLLFDLQSPAPGVSL